MDELNQVLTLVTKLREAQKKYFASRTQTRLNEAKALEAEVDRMLLSYSETNVAVQATLGGQTSLFGGQ